MKGIFILLLAFAVSSYPAEKKNGVVSQNSVELFLASKKYALKDVGIVVKNLNQNENPIVAINPDSMFNPASVAKLLTAAVAFDKFGPWFCFSTRIFADTILEQDSGITVRNLFIQGTGDPGFTAERLWLFVEHLYHCGIRQITGDLILDDSFFDSLIVGPGFDEDTTSRSYQPLISALAMNFNTVAIHHRPGPRAKFPIAADLFPEIKGLKVVSSATTTAKNKKNTLEIITLPDSGTTRVMIQGTMGLDEQGGYTYRKLWQTWEPFGNALLPLFERRGILLRGKVRHERVPTAIASRAPFYEFSSEPISKTVNYMFKYSSNFAAEMLFKSLSAKRDTVPGAWDKSASLVTGWWKEHALPGIPIIKNGSGLGNTNRMSPAQIVSLLSYVWKQKAYCPEYLAALSTAGFDGTIKTRFLKSPLKGLVRAKTGTLNTYGISTLAGYVLLPEKPPLAFAIFCNKTRHTQYEDWVLQEQLLEKIAETAQ